MSMLHLIFSQFDVTTYGTIDGGALFKGESFGRYKRSSCG